MNWYIVMAGVCLTFGPLFAIASREQTKAYDYIISIFLALCLNVLAVWAIGESLAR